MESDTAVLVASGPANSPRPACSGISLPSALPALLGCLSVKRLEQIRMTSREPIVIDDDDSPKLTSRQPIIIVDDSDAEDKIDPSSTHSSRKRSISESESDEDVNISYKMTRKKKVRRQSSSPLPHQLRSRQPPSSDSTRRSGSAQSEDSTFSITTDDEGSNGANDDDEEENDEANSDNSARDSDDDLANEIRDLARMLDRTQRSKPVNTNKQRNLEEVRVRGWQRLYPKLPRHSRRLLSLSQDLTDLHCDVEVGKTYQIRPQSSECVHVDQIFESQEGELFVKGWHLRADESETRWFTQTIHSEYEVFLIAYSSERGNNLTLEDCQVVMKLPRYMRPRRVHFTNELFMTYENSKPRATENKAILLGDLMCKTIVQLRVSSSDFVHGHTIRSLLPTEVEALGGTTVSGLDALNAWLDGDWLDDLHLGQEKVITYADIGAGGGGSTRGAVNAGCEVKWVLDHDDDACRTLRENFELSSERVICADLAIYKHMEFTFYVQVDILWISLPCPDFSSLKRGDPNPDNLSLGRELTEILMQTRPRVVLMEQVENIRSSYQGQYFHEYIQQLTLCGFQVSTQVENAASFGTCQPRKRLFITAFRHGETLPNLPPHTHGPDGSGLRPYSTVRDKLAPLDNVELSGVKSVHRKMTEQPRSLDLPLYKLIDTTGQIAHPSGERGCTVAELSLMQDHDLSHEYPVPASKAFRQIGNMVAVAAAQAHISNVVRQLRANNTDIEKEIKQEGFDQEDFE